MTLTRRLGLATALALFAATPALARDPGVSGPVTGTAS